MNAAPELASADRAVIDGWWQHFVDTGRLPESLPVVQQRLVRAVHRGELPSGPVHLKVMTFPRPKDRLRYCLRRLPAAHEANMLRALAAVGITCPQVVDVRTRRRRGLPSHSLLVLRTLPVLAGQDATLPAERLREEAGLAVRLLASGIEHHDLHGENFLRLTSGELAVIDLQSARRCRPGALRARARLAAAARLLRERSFEPEASTMLVAAGLLRDTVELDAVTERVRHERARFWRSRVRRCLLESTEFARRWRWNGVEHRLRGPLGAGRWHHGGRLLRRAWIGQRVLHLHDGRPPVFRAFFRKWWWLGGGDALYVPAACSDRNIESEVRSASAGFAWFRSGATGRDVEVT